MSAKGTEAQESLQIAKQPLSRLHNSMGGRSGIRTLDLGIKSPLL